MTLIDDANETLRMASFFSRNGEMRNIRVKRSVDGIAVIVSEDKTGNWGWLKHFSISRANCYPTWDEILAAKEEIMGDIDCMMVMPKKEDYVNIHKFTFHVWQTPQDWGIQ